jgi:hypothetical protein
MFVDPDYAHDESVVTCLLTAIIVEPEKMSVVNKWLCKYVFIGTKPLDHCSRYTCNNRGTVGGGGLC